MTTAGALPRRIEALPGTALRSSLARWEPLAALFLAVVVFGAVQTASPDIVGIDGQYHIKVAALIREQGPRIDFPWLRFTLLNQADYSDHHLLLHLLQAPFTLLDLRLAAKVSSVVFACLSFWGCYLFMARSGVRWPLAWLALVLAVSHTFLWRHSMARAQSLSLLLLVGALWLIFERRLRWLIPLGFAASWLFDGSLLTLSAPLAALAAGFLLHRQLDWRPLAYLALGIALGMLLHPYFPRNVLLTSLHLLPKIGLAGQEQVPVGREWYPYSASAFYSRVGPSLAVMCFGLLPMLARLWRRERPDLPSLTLAFMSLGFLALVVRSQRIIEYYPAFAVLSAAWGWSFAGLPAPARLIEPLARWRPALGLLAGLLLVGWLTWTVELARRDTVGNAAANARLDSYREAALWLATNSPPRSLVFNTDWDDFPQLFFWNTHNVYVVGLDPTRMSLFDPELYRLWRGIATGTLTSPSGALNDRFGAEYVFSDSRHGAFLSVAAADPGLAEVFRSPEAIVFKVQTGPP
jgi:hypothetical protein